LAEKNMKRRGQVTIFVILGILIVSAILVFIIFIRPSLEFRQGQQSGFESCVNDAVELSVSELEGSAGFIDPEFTYPYEGSEIAYLCYTNEYYRTCTIQKPFLKQHFEEHLRILLNRRINECYTNSVNELRTQGYIVNSGEVSYDLVLEPGQIRVEIEAPTSAGSTRASRFNVVSNSPIYEMTMLATSILQQETRYGEANNDYMMVLYPDYIISKIKRGDGTKIYTIRHKTFGNEFTFASRSLVFPAGYLA